MKLSRLVMPITAATAAVALLGAVGGPHANAKSAAMRPLDTTPVTLTMGEQRTVQLPCDRTTPHAVCSILYAAVHGTTGPSSPAMARADTTPPPYPPSTTYGPGVHQQVAANFGTSVVICSVSAFGGKSNGSTMWGQGYSSCNQKVFAMSLTVTAWYCSPILWGCVWFNQGTMSPGGTCNIAGGVTAMWCPGVGAFTRGGITNGQQWLVQVDACVIPTTSDPQSCGTADQQVQF